MHYIYVKFIPKCSKVGSNCLIVIVCCDFFPYGLTTRCDVIHKSIYGIMQTIIFL